MVWEINKMHYCTLNNILQYINQHPNTYLREVYKNNSLHHSVGCINQNISKMVEKGLLTKERTGKKMIISVTKIGKEVCSLLDKLNKYDLGLIK